MNQHFLNHFKKKDPILYKAALKSGKAIIKTESDNYFASLCESIISQQLSVKASDVIYNRFKLLLDNVIEPEQVQNHSVEELRKLGISNPKARYILDLAEKVSTQQVHLHALKKMSEQEVIDELTKVKGIGKWTAEMFLMFSLGREDIFSTGDLGLKRAIEKLYNIQDPTIDKLIEISSNWKPYRTYACRILWNSLDNTP